ncbi:MAG TPA: MBL fold metallo-hydrolase [Bacillota bacterium]|nr:MBL fold metallo-hydrolase [Bacillota bacterium]
MERYKVIALKVGFLETNCYIVRDTESGCCCVIDPGADAALIKSTMRELDTKCTLILLTHGHFDHILALEDMRTTRAVVAIHASDAHCLTERDSFSPMLPYDPRPFSSADVLLKREGTYELGGFTFRITHTPGHTAGSVCYIFDDMLFTGDTLFCSGIGRTDFPGSSAEQMNASLKKLYHMPGDYVVYPGHGEKTLLSDERDSNPYMAFIRRESRQ